jgi:hypothetical protein
LAAAWSGGISPHSWKNTPIWKWCCSQPAVAILQPQVLGKSFSTTTNNCTAEFSLYFKALFWGLYGYIGKYPFPGGGGQPMSFGRKNMNRGKM